MSGKYLFKLGMALCLIVIPSLVFAKPLVNVSIKAEMEVVVKSGDKKMKKRVPAKNVSPGKTVFYTISYHNDGDEKATNVVIDNPIPAGAVYLPGSAHGDGDITYSIDGGKSYSKPSLLFYEVKDEHGKNIKKIASPDEYTNIRWVIPAVEAGKQGTAGYQVIIK